MNQLLRQTRRGMITRAMFKKLFSMIGGYGEDGFIPALKLLQGQRQTRNLLVDPVHAGVVERQYLFPVRLQSFDPDISTIPQRIEKARLSSRNRP